MKQIYLLFACGLSLSAVAGFYAISGLIAIFATAPLAIAIMGSILEGSKLVIASWMYNNWKEIPRTFKLYFSTALVILMMLTSMGIFGYLSKAHLDQAVPTGDVVSKVALIDERINAEKETISGARKALQQLDAQVDQTLARTTDDKGAERSVQIRRGQQKERAVLLADIGSAQTRIARLNEERAPIAAELRKVEAEVGPIKYIAALIYGDDKLDDTVLEKAVRIVIIMIVIVFDPLAVILLIAANYSLRRREEIKNDTREFPTKEDREAQEEAKREYEQSTEPLPPKEYNIPNPVWWETKAEPEAEAKPKAPRKPRGKGKQPATEEGEPSGWLASEPNKVKRLPTDFLTKVKGPVQTPVKQTEEVGGWQYTSYTKPEEQGWTDKNPLNDPSKK